MDIILNLQPREINAERKIQGNRTEIIMKDEKFARWLTLAYQAKKEKQKNKKKTMISAKVFEKSKQI